MESESSELDRYQRQTRFAPLGPDGQRKLLASRVLICGCGALGSVLANTLVRAGVGFVRLVDRDFLELSNLQRQVLYDEQDVQSGLPKAVVAAERLRRINSQVVVEPHVADIDHTNLAHFADGVNLILDGSDNFEIRFLINDYALDRKVPWVYGGCLGSEGQTMTILPGRTPCLRCLIPEPPPAGSTPTCDTAGILGPVINVIASLQAAEALKILSEQWAAVSRYLTVVDVWDTRLKQISLETLGDRQACPACSGRERPWLSGARASQSAVLCGRNSVQLSFPGQAGVDLDEICKKLACVGPVQANPFLVRCSIGTHRITIFADGRAIIGGTEEVAEARAIYAKFVGH